MKKIFFVIIILLHIYNIYGERYLNPDDYSEYQNKINYVHRNYSEPEIIINGKDNIPMIWNQNMSDIIYYSLYIYKNIPGNYTDQTLFSSIVEGLSQHPCNEFHGVFYSILVADYLHVNLTIDFEVENKSDTKVIIKTEKEEIVFLFKNDNNDKEILKNHISLLNTNAEITPRIEKETIEYFWYIFWGKMFELDPKKCVNIDNKEKYESMNSLFNKFNRKEFCYLGQNNVLDILIKYYNLQYQNISSIEYIALSELINRAYVAPM